MKEKNKKRHLGIVLLIVILAYTVLFCFQGLRKCYYYHKFFGSHTEKLVTLSAPIIEISLPKEQSSTGISLGYAQVPVNSAEVEHIKFYEELGMVVIDLNSVSFHFEFPWETSKPEPQPKETFLVPQLVPPLINSKWKPCPSEKLFQLELKAARMMPKKYLELFMMKNREFADYMEHAFVKTMVCCGRNGTGIFETDQIKGLLHFGSRDDPSVLYVTVFCKQSDITQSIYIKSISAEKSKEAMLSLLSSYKFLIIELPEQDVWCQSISSELKKYGTFEIVHPHE